MSTPEPDMTRHIVDTGDGSHSLYVPALDEQYHSRHGALQESRHVFIAKGWDAVVEGRKSLRILEIGFGTGLNALLTVAAGAAQEVEVHYTGVEAYPLSWEEARLLNYASQMGEVEAAGWFAALHRAAWGEDVVIREGFVLHKLRGKIEEFVLAEPVDLIYFDAFAPTKQPELWTVGVFERMRGMLRAGGLLTTYCSKGDVRRAMLAAGFRVEKVGGPVGKREMLRGWG